MYEDDAILQSDCSSRGDRQTCPTKLTTRFTRYRQSAFSPRLLDVEDPFLAW